MIKKMRLKILVLTVGILISLTLVLAGFQLGTYNFEKIYGGGDVLRGSISIGFTDALGNKLLSAFNSSITLKEFLDANNAVYSCEGGCDPDYSLSNPKPTQTISLNKSEEKIIGLKLTGQVNDIKDFSFNVSSNADKSCEPPLEVNLLNDEYIELVFEDPSDDFTCLAYDTYGCFDVNEAVDSSTKIIDASYCGKIMVPVAREYKVGATVTKISGSDNATFTFVVLGEDTNDNCEVSTNETGTSTISCIVELELEEDGEVDVCLSIDDSDKNYNIRFEENNPCGYIELGATKINRDFDIFIRPGKYAEVGDFVFDKDFTGINLTTEIKNYIASKYNYNCTPECIIPISFKAGIKQDVVVSNLNLQYFADLKAEESELIYQLNKPNPMITLPSKTLDISKAGLIVPSVIGNHSFILKLDGTAILTNTITVKALPTVQSVIPSKVPALLDNTFIAIYDESFGNFTGLSFSWDFGDGTTGTSIDNRIKHKYSIEGSYNLKVTMKSNFGESIKTIQVNVTSPKDSILPLIEDYNSWLNTLEPELKKLPSWIKAEVEKTVNVASLKIEIQKQADAFPLVKVDQGYLEIMRNLINLTVPKSLEKVSVIKQPSKVFPNPNQLNMNALSSFGAGDYTGSARDYAASVNGWIRENLEISLDAEEYYFNYPDRNEIIFSSYKIILTPKTTTSNIYFSISGTKDEIATKEDYSLKSSGGNVGFEITGLTEAKTIEFLHPDELEIGDFPFYLSPKTSELDLNIISGNIICNQNKICEEDRGENYNNCRIDCKPVGWTTLLILLLLMGALVVYIVLQEWYKRHYETQLFSDRNQLYNLINFMNNALNQGVTGKEIIGKLGQMGWNKERLIYAWKKLNGQRTGMWEIPVFKWIEKKKVRQELRKRQGMGNQTVPPKPMGKPPARGIERRQRRPRV